MFNVLPAQTRDVSWKLLYWGTMSRKINKILKVIVCWGNNDLIIICLVSKWVQIGQTSNHRVCTVAELCSSQAAKISEIQFHWQLRCAFPSSVHLTVGEETLPTAIEFILQNVVTTVDLYLYDHVLGWLCSSSILAQGLWHSYAWGDLDTDNEGAEEVKLKQHLSISQPQHPTTPATPTTVLSWS